MNNQINDGGPAFATTATATSIARREDGSSMLTNYGSSAGMSLRDYFAAAALSSMHTTQELNILEPGKENSQMAERAYRIADAMLKAREAKP